jgi:exonuclease III
MRVIFWNIRAGGGRRAGDICRQLQQWQPDIVALSEFRGTPASTRLAAFLADDGLCHQLTTTHPARPALNALLLASRFPLRQFWLQTAPQETTRWLLAHIDATPSFSIGVMHIPNYVSGRKYPFYEAVLAMIDRWFLGPGLLIGDTNSGLPGLDEETKVFGRREAGWFQALDAQGWVDIYRHLKGQERVYTWYSPNGGNGFRLDQAFINQPLLPAVADVRYEWGQSSVDLTRRDALSDHAALIVDLDLRRISSEEELSG